MRRAAIYARYSSENQRDESIDAQICAIEEYARKNDIAIVKTYVDRAKSATTAERPAFQEMIRMSETGLFDTIIVHKLDRFARSKYDSAVYKQKLKVNNVRLLSVTENLDGTPELIILESVLEAMAEYYSKNLAREIMKGTMENAKKTDHCGGVPPLGFDIEDKKLIINEHEAEAIKLIFEMYADGRGYTEIINILNYKGYKTKRGNPFGKNSLFEILRNEKYKGVYTYNKSSHKSAKGTYNRHEYKDDSDIIRIKDGCPRIVSDELFNRVEERMSKNKQSTQRNRDRQKYLLSGLVFCGKCGSPMHANRRKKDSQLTFRCNRKVQNIDCKAREINMGYLEAYVLEELHKNIFSFNRINSIMKMIEGYANKINSKAEESADRLREELKNIQKIRSNILFAIEQGVVEEHFSGRLAELKEQQENIKAELILTNQPKSFKVTRKEVMLMINNFQRMIIEMDFDGLRKIILRFIDKITVMDDKIDVFLKFSFGDISIKGAKISKVREQLMITSDVPLTKRA